jgi:DNA polymerase-3 subunit delta'
MSAADLSPLQGHGEQLDKLRRLVPRQGEGERRHHHAFIFCGPMGTGKFKAALWLAARLKCEQPGNCRGLFEEGAGQLCDRCGQLAAGSHPDLAVVEPMEDGRPIYLAQIVPRKKPEVTQRPLVATLAMRPLRPGPHVAIIRDAELLRVEAQNAMLKLLEEPPGDCVLVLVTANPTALLPTVRSRCQFVRFGLLDDDELGRVMAAQGIDSHRSAEIALLAGGRADLALATNERAIDERLKLVSSWEELLANPLLPLEPLVRQLAGKSGKDSSTPERKRRMKLLAEWQLAKARAALGQSRPQGNGELDRLLANAAAVRSPRRLVHDSLTMNSCTLALGRNANAKLAIRDALLHIRG